MPLVTTTTASRCPTEKEAFDNAMANVLAAIKGLQQIGARYFYGSPGNRLTEAEMQSRIDAYGPDAVVLFQVSGMMSQAAQIATGEAPALVMPPGIDFSVDEKTGRIQLSGKAEDAVIAAPIVEVTEDGKL